MYNNKTRQKLKAQLLREWEYILLQLKNNISGNWKSGFKEYFIKNNVYRKNGKHKHMFICVRMCSESNFDYM